MGHSEARFINSFWLLLAEVHPHTRSPPYALTVRIKYVVSVHITGVFCVCIYSTQGMRIVQASDLSLLLLIHFLF
jgi:hypothetical protein